MVWSISAATNSSLKLAILQRFQSTGAERSLLATFLGKRWNRLFLASILIVLTGLQLGGQDNALVPAGIQFPSVFPEIVEEKKRRPSKPLSNESLQLVLKAGLVNISYVDVSRGHRKHPHMGARDRNLKWGYVYDVTRLRRNPPAFNLSGAELAEECGKRDSNYKALQRITVDVQGHEMETEGAGKKRARILCGVYSTEAYHHKIPAIRETWGQKCDGFFVASNKTDTSIDAIDIPHAGAEEYHNMWSKVRSIWSYIYDNYYHDYDWFHLGGDDMWLIVENLRLYLESEEIQTAANGGTYLPDSENAYGEKQVPLYLGSTFAQSGNLDDLYQTGGPGYTLNKAALKILVVEGLPNMFVNMRRAIEDLLVGRIFKHYNVYPYRTTDEDGGERYNHFPPGRHFEGKEAFFYRKWTRGLNYTKGANHSAVRSAAFHYVASSEIRRLHALLYGLCPKNSSLAAV